jgi:hypothetical protein
MKTETTKVWNLFENDLILVNDKIYEILDIIESVQRRRVVAIDEEGNKEIFINTVFKRIIKDGWMR